MKDIEIYNSIITDYQSGLSMRAVAIKYDTNHRFIARVLERCNIQKRKRIKQNKTKCKFSNKLERDYNNMATHLKFDVDYKWYMQFSGIEKIKCLNRLLACRKGRLPIVNTTDEYKEFILHFYYDEQFIKIYNKWILSKTDKYKKPSVDHIIPKSKGGKNKLHNYQILSWFENRAKNNLSQIEWDEIKKNIKDYLV